MIYKRNKKNKIMSSICVTLAAVIISTGVSSVNVRADEDRHQNPVYSYEDLSSSESSEENKVDNDISDGQLQSSEKAVSNIENINTSPFDFDGTVLRTDGVIKGIEGVTPSSRKYDPRDYGLTTQVKDQQKLGICWTFAGNAALETFLKKNGYGTYNFSEEHMRWWAKGGQNNWDIGDTEGSTNETSIGYFTSWSGPKMGEDIPYNGNQTTSEGAKRPHNYDSAKMSDYRVLDVVNVASDKTSVKSAILKYGAITSGYYDSPQYMNKDLTAFYCDEQLGQTHAITIVGWDDDYPAGNFTGKAKPHNNGAWLIKNSWGKYNKENGYMWISYEDKTILSYTDNYAIGRVRKDLKQRMYQHEYSMSSTISGKLLTGANKFKFGKHESLQGIMFATDSIGAHYELYFVPEVKGNLKFHQKYFIKSGTVPFSGYITSDIDNFPLPTGNGALAVKIDNSINNKKSTLGLEKNVANFNMFKAKASIGESFILSNGVFHDLNRMEKYKPANLVIKGITKPVDGGIVMAGGNRYDTAAKISSSGWSSSENLVLVNGKAIADALTSTPLAKLKDAPILLTENDRLNANVVKEINRLGVKNVTIIGGETSISSKVEKELKNKKINVERIYGKDRFGTSNMIAKEVLKLNDKVDSISVVNGYTGLADAISFSSVAGEKSIPILLVDRKGKLKSPSEISNSEKVKKTFIIGGDKSVPNLVEKDLVNPTRISGKDRNNTNAKILEKFYDKESIDNVFIAKDGLNDEDMLIDGLAVGAYASKVYSPIVISHGKLSDEQRDVLKNKKVKNYIQVGNGMNSMATTELLILSSKK